jgi:hypothetical protein
MEIILNIVMKYTLISENTAAVLFKQPIEFILSFLMHSFCAIYLDSSQEVRRMDQEASNFDGFVIPLKICIGNVWVNSVVKRV